MLCEWQLDENEAIEASTAACKRPDNLKTQPLGQDAAGRQYYMVASRLYSRTAEGDVLTVCTSADELEAFIAGAGGLFAPRHQAHLLCVRLYNETLPFLQSKEKVCSSSNPCRKNVCKRSDRTE